VRARFIERWDGPLAGGERPDPSPGPGEVAVDVEACGVGLTVLNCIRGDLGTPGGLPRVPGHELVGVVRDVGPGVAGDLAGARVAAYFYLFCGRCPRCLAGGEPMCERLAGFVGVHRDGGYAERAVLPARNAIPLPAALDPMLATAIPDAVATPVHVARRAALGPADRVAVIAAGGGVGAHMVQVARLAGARVAGLEAGAAKLAFLEDDIGADAVDSSHFGAVRLPAGWDRGPDVVIDLLGTAESLGWSLAALAPGGRLVVLTTFPGREVAVAPREAVLRELTVLGSRYAGRAEVAHAAELVAEGRVRPVVTRRAGPDGVDALHEALHAGDLVGRGALVWPR
jgi:D-arabinose 1-dehydrogenase-like Zn-dependent alcohol dehydrogenase